MMSNFQNTFNRLKKERQLSNKQVASFTGVKVKDVKKWETGMSFPTDSKVVDALEGILGTEIIKSLEGFKTEENNSKFPILKYPFFFVIFLKTVILLLITS